MKIEKLSVEDFKGLKSVDLEPENINLITGRNNTGKSSLLEAINLLFNPTYISEFRNNYSNIIREKKKSSEISALINKNKKTSLRLEKIPYEDIWEEVLINFIEDYIGRIKRFSDRYENLDWDEEEWTNIEEILQQTIENQLEDLSPSDVLDQPLKIIKDQKHFLYVLSEISAFIERKEIYDKLKNEFEWDKIKNKYQELRRIIHIPTSFRFRDPYGGFIDQRPNDSKEVRVIKELDPRKLAKNEDDEKVAVKTDDIEDYIKKNELLNDFKSFNLNQLVFTENGEKYGVPYEFMGDGFKTMVGILWHLLEGDYEEEVCLIEEPENHMHPGYTRELVYFLIDISKEYDTQFFITTHDRDFIEGFFGDNIKKDEKDYLKENFLVINMKRDYHQAFSYEDSEYHIEELLKDLRGI